MTRVESYHGIRIFSFDKECTDYNIIVFNWSCGWVIKKIMGTHGTEITARVYWTLAEFLSRHLFIGSFMYIFQILYPYAQFVKPLQMSKFPFTSGNHIHIKEVRALQPTVKIVYCRKLWKDTMIIYVIELCTHPFLLSFPGPLLLPLCTSSNSFSFLMDFGAINHFKIKLIATEVMPCWHKLLCCTQDREVYFILGYFRWH